MAQSPSKQWKLEVITPCAESGSSLEIGFHSCNINVRLSATHLARKDFFGLGKSDPYIKILKKNLDGISYTPIFQSEVIKKNLNPGNSFDCNQMLTC